MCPAEVLEISVVVRTRQPGGAKLVDDASRSTDLRHVELRILLSPTTTFVSSRLGPLRSDVAGKFGSRWRRGEPWLVARHSRPLTPWQFACVLVTRSVAKRWGERLHAKILRPHWPLCFARFASEPDVARTGWVRLTLIRHVYNRQQGCYHSAFTTSTITSPRASP